MQRYVEEEEEGKDGLNEEMRMMMRRRRRGIPEDKYVGGGARPDHLAWQK